MVLHLCCKPGPEDWQTRSIESPLSDPELNDHQDRAHQEQDQLS